MRRFLAFAVGCLVLFPALSAPVSAASPLVLGAATSVGASLTPPSSTWVPAGGTCRTGTDGTIYYRCAWEFDLSGIPAGQIITAASLRVTRTGGCATNDCPVDLMSFPGTDTENFVASEVTQGAKVTTWTPADNSPHLIKVLPQIRAHYLASETWAGFSLRDTPTGTPNAFQDFDLGGAGAVQLTVTYAPAAKLTIGMSAVDPGAFGSVMSSPEGIDCGSTCEAYFVVGSTVTLTAHPQAGAALGTWEAGPCLGSTNVVCKFTMPGTDTLAGVHWALAPPPTPTPKPTPKSTQRVETAPPETFVPGSPTPEITEAPPSPTEAVTEPPTTAPVATPSPTAGPTTPASDSGGGFLLPLLVIGAGLAIVIVVGGLAMSRRRSGANPS